MKNAPVVYCCTQVLCQPFEPVEPQWLTEIESGDLRGDDAAQDLFGAIGQRRGGNTDPAAHRKLSQARAHRFGLDGQRLLGPRRPPSEPS